MSTPTIVEVNGKKGYKLPVFAKWKKRSENWIRTLIRRGTLKADWIVGLGVPFYLIPVGTKLPPLLRGRPPGSKTKKKPAGAHNRKTPALPIPK